LFRTYYIANGPKYIKLGREGNEYFPKKIIH